MEQPDFMDEKIVNVKVGAEKEMYWLNLETKKLIKYEDILNSLIN